MYGYAVTRFPCDILARSETHVMPISTTRTSRGYKQDYTTASIGVYQLWERRSEDQTPDR